MKIGYELIVKDVDIPWGFSFLPDNSILIIEKEGELIHFKNGKRNWLRVCLKLLFEAKEVY